MNEDIIIFKNSQIPLQFENYLNKPFMSKLVFTYYYYVHGQIWHVDRFLKWNGTHWVKCDG